MKHNSRKNDARNDIDTEIAAADGLMLLVVILVVIGGLIVTGVSALIGLM